MEHQYRFNQIMGAFELRGVHPCEDEKQVLDKEKNRLKIEIEFAQNLIKRIDKALNVNKNGNKGVTINEMDKIAGRIAREEGW